jgi:cytochrome c oxidase subunit 2
VDSTPDRTPAPPRVSQRFGSAWRVVRSRRSLILIALAPIFLAGCQVPTFGAYRGATTQGRDAFKLWQGFFIAGLVIGGFVLLLILWAVFRYRKRSEEIPRQSQYHRLVEILYTVVPLIIVSVMFVFVVITENEVDATPKGQVQVQVTAFQWGWQFYYPATGKVVEGETTEAPQMVVPAGETINVSLKSADVIHGFYIPQFNYSRYAQPGTVNHFNFNILHNGVYRGQCTQLCGLYHSLMLFSVKAVNPAQFAAWEHNVPSNNATIGQLKAQIKAGGPGA